MASDRGAVIEETLVVRNHNLGNNADSEVKIFCDHDY